MAGSAQSSGNLVLTTGQTGDGALALAFSSLFNLTNFLVEPAFAVHAAGDTITLPGSPAKVVFVQNLHATQTLSVAWTAGGTTVATILLVLQPGEFILLGGQSGGSGGITALKLTGSLDGTTAKIVAAA
jgi:hypothetical protein